LPLNIAKVAGEIIDSDAPKILITRHLREEGTPDGHSPCSVTARERFFARDNAVYAREREVAAIARCDPRQVRWRHFHPRRHGAVAFAIYSMTGRAIRPVKIISSNGINQGLVFAARRPYAILKCHGCPREHTAQNY
jgi:hypothetical protein